MSLCNFSWKASFSERKGKYETEIMNTESYRKPTNLFKMFLGGNNFSTEKDFTINRFEKENKIKNIQKCCNYALL